MPADQHAREAAEELLTSGLDGLKVERLVLTTHDGRDRGGWCEGALRDQIKPFIDAAVAEERAKDREVMETLERALRHNHKSDQECVHKSTLAIWANWLRIRLEENNGTP